MWITLIMNVAELDCCIWMTHLILFWILIMDYSNLIVLMSHTTVLRDRPGADRVISNCSLPLAWKPKSNKHYEHDNLMVIAANMDSLHFTLAPNTIATVRQLRLTKTRCSKRGSKLKRQCNNPITHQTGINFPNITAIRRCSMITRKSFTYQASSLTVNPSETRIV